MGPAVLEGKNLNAAYFFCATSQIRQATFDTDAMGDDAVLTPSPVTVIGSERQC